MSQPERVAEIVHLEPRRTPLRAAVAALRPRQWVKNTLVFAGIVFAAELGDPARWGAALVALVAYCAASSAAYLLNDVRDLEADRSHPVKRRRPIARGELSTRLSVAVAAGLLALAAATSAVLGAASLACLGAFVALQAAYTLRLRELVLVDTFAIAGLFVLRAAAGALAVDVPISPWLLLCTGLLALFLALGKRRAELALVGRAAAPGRSALSGYSVGAVDHLLTTVAASTISVYALYTLTARDSQELLVTVPFVVFGLLRYLVLLRAGTVGEEPENVLLGDRPILLTVAAWVALCGALLSLD